MDRHEDDLARMPMWKSYLYHLQQQAPKPKKIVCQREVPNKPPFYGREFHGAMSREDADFLLTIGGEGSFLIRESQRATGQYTLALRFVDSTKNFKLYYDGQHYVGEKRFDNVQDLVADGLITFYLESKAADYIAALSNESNYAESPYVAYNTFKKRQLAHPSRRTRSRNERNRPVPAVVATTAAASSIPRSESESGRESGNSSSGSVGVATAAAAGASGLPPPPPQPQQQAPTPQLGIGAIPKTSRANIPVSSQFVEKRRSQAEASGQQVVTTTTAIATTAAAVETIPEDTGNYTSPIAATKKVTQPNPTYQQVMVISQAPTQPAVSSTPPVTATTDDVAAALEASAALAASQPYYQNCEQIALHQQLLLQQKEQLRLSQQIPPPPDEPPPRPPATATTTTVTSTAVVQSAASASVVTAAPSEMVTTTTAVVDNSGVSAVDGRVSHSTNTDGPPKPPLPTPLPAIRGKKPAPVTTTTAANIPVAMATGAAKPAPTKPAPTKPTPVASPVVPKLTSRPVSAVTPTSKPVTIATAATPRPASVATTTVVTAAPVQPRRKSPSRSPSPRARVRDSKKTHSFKMFENFAVSPPGSPPPPGIVGPGGDFKLSSVSWCTDYLEVMGCEKPHNFKLHTFKGPHWCDFCANFLWGLIAQGVKCQDCGLNAHKKCSERVPNDCMPDMKYVKRVFGIDLTTLVKAQNTLIPAVVELCVKEIESRGLDAEGLYRVAGFHDDVEAIKMSFDKDIETTDITEEGYDDINTITSVLKLYFRLLPIPLVTFEIYFRVIDTVRREDINLDIKLEKLKQMLAQLPPAHYHTLKYLMAHLFRVTEQQTKNMMNAENLSIVFAPTVLRSPETDPLSSLTAVKYERELIEMLINHHTTLFE